MTPRATLWIGRSLSLAATLSLAACTETIPTALQPTDASTSAAASLGHATQIDYDSRSLAEYQQNWANIYGPLSLDAGGTRSVAPNGDFTVSAVPFQVGADFSVFDHLKYIAVSTRSFDVPEEGSLTFSVRIEASTPGTESGRVVHGCYGAPFSYLNVGDPCAAPWTSTPLEGQQAGVVLNMINFATGQLFDWFVSESQVFALIERLPSNVTNPALVPTDAGYVGLDRAYTQIIRAESVAPGKKYDVAIRYSRSASTSRVEYYLDGKLFASVDNVGVPLDRQGQPYTGTYASLGSGEVLRDELDSFVIGHGLFSLLDAFPFQHPERPDLSVSIPMSERLFGQGATGTFSNFQVTTR
jgi:hypothetical protein